MNWQVTKFKILRWSRKIILYSLYVVVLSLFLGFTVLQIPRVQESIISRLLGRFSQISGFHAEVGSFYLRWYDRLEITGLTIIDPENNKMLKADKLKVNFKISSLFGDENISIDAATLDDTEFNLVYIADSDTSKNLNLNIFLDRLSKPSSGGNTSAKVNIGEIIINNSTFSYDDKSTEVVTGFDYHHFGVALHEGAVEDFQVIGDTIQFNLVSLSAEETDTKLAIKEMSTFFRISQSSLEFLGIHANIGHSIIADTLIFTYNSQLDLQDFNKKVNVKAHLDKTVLDPRDLALFTSGAGSLKQPITVSGKMNGKISRFTTRDMEIKIGNTQLEGSLAMDGLPLLDETFINLNLTRGAVDVYDLAFLFDDDVFNRIKPLGRFMLQGSFTGFTNDFVAKGDFNGSLGRIKSDMNLKINQQNIEQSTYAGNLELDNIDLGKYLKDTLYQYVSLKGNIKGKGLTEETADFVLDGTIQSVGVMGYNYTNIVTNARFTKQLFSGFINVGDPNLNFKANGSIDFTPGHKEVKIIAILDTLNLQALGFSTENFSVKSVIDINTRGLQLDSLFGEIILNKTAISYQDENLQLDSVHLVSALTDGKKVMSLKSSLLNATLVGDYHYSTIFTDLTRLMEEFRINIVNDKIALEEYYSHKHSVLTPYEASFTFQLIDINPILELADIPLNISGYTTIDGRFSNGFTSIVSGYSQIDTIRFDNKLFIDNELDFTGSKIRDSTNVLANVTFTSATQQLSKSLSTKNLLVEGIWNKDHVDLGVDVDQEGYNNSLRIKSELDFLEDSIRVKVLPSRIRILNNDWMVNQNNVTLIKGSEMHIHDFEITRDSQAIQVHGFVSQDPEKLLRLNVNDLNLNFINVLSTEKFDGIVNGFFEASDLYHNPFVQNSISVKNFTINEFLIGDLTGKNVWDKDAKKFKINLLVDRQNIRTIVLTGDYDPAQAESPMNLEADFDKVNLKIIEPVIKDIFSKIDGTLTGKYSITGTFGSPKVRGEGKISNGQIMINYLKTLYAFDGTLGMTPSQIVFEDFEMTDTQQNHGTLNGYIAHKDFLTFRINLDATFSDFQLMNTLPKDNDLFYGTAYATGNLNIFGPTSNLKISATARTEKDTKLFIPVGGTASAEKKEYINFVHFTDTTVARSLDVMAKEKKELTGITLDLNIDVTPEAYAEIIFDIKSGDIIRGRGNGDIKLQLDTKGEFNMFGLLEFTEGAYNFTLGDIFNKEFIIKPGSRITWYGDPYAAELNITGGYRQLASLSPIISDPAVANDINVRRKYPTEVLLKLNGAMLAPNINFDITATDLPQNVSIAATPESPARNVNLDFEFRAFKAKLDEQELQRQVFSLIVLRRFSSPESFTATGLGASSVTELLSNQLSYWLSQVDPNLQVDFDLGTFDANSFGAAQLRVSYSFLNGRLRLTRDGTIAGQSQQSSVSAIAGDWTVDYTLTANGNLKAKMYSRSNYNTVLSSIGTQSLFTTGFSLAHTKNFNTFNLKAVRERKRKEQEEAEKNKEAEDDPAF